MLNRVRYGLANVHYALMNEGGLTGYAAPVRLPGAVSLSLTALGDVLEKIDIRGNRRDVGLSGTGYDGTFEIALIPWEFRRDVLGEREEGGIAREYDRAKRRRFALLFEFKGDVTNTRHVLYNCAAQRPAITGNTKKETIEPAVETLNLLALPDCRGAVSGRTTEHTPSEIVYGWYNRVY